MFVEDHLIVKKASLSRELNCAMSTALKVIKTIIMYHFPQLGPIHTATEAGWQPHGWGKITNE